MFYAGCGVPWLSACLDARVSCQPLYLPGCLLCILLLSALMPSPLVGTKCSSSVSHSIFCMSWQFLNNIVSFLVCLTNQAINHFSTGIFYLFLFFNSPYYLQYPAWFLTHRRFSVNIYWAEHTFDSAVFWSFFSLPIIPFSLIYQPSLQ